MLHRYNNFDYIRTMKIKEFRQLVETAREKEKEQRIHDEWCAHLPFMSMKFLEYISFRDYMDKVTGKNIDLRPASEILAEIEEIEKKFGEKNG